MRSPAFAETPLVRALLRTLLFAVVLEALFYRFLTIPGGGSVPGWVAHLHESTGRAGSMMFAVAFGVLLPTLVAVAYAALRVPSWPGGTNGVAAVGLLVLVALSISAAISGRGPAFALGFSGMSLLLCLLLLEGMYETRADTAGRAFAVVLGGSLLLSGAAEMASLLGMLGGPVVASPIVQAAASSGLWLLLAAGLLCWPAFQPPASAARGERAAAWGVAAASALVVAVGAIVQPSLLSRVAPGLGLEGAGSFVLILGTSVAAASTFLSVTAGFRGLARPPARARAQGILLLLLAGCPRTTAYQHLLAVLGVALLSAIPARPAPVAPVFLAFDERRVDA